MNHLGDTNKKISETPRTDAKRGFHGLDTAVDAEFSEELERELNAANERIKRLIEAGSLALGYAAKGDLESADEVWDKAKEDKL